MDFQRVHQTFIFWNIASLYVYIKELKLILYLELEVQNYVQ